MKRIVKHLVLASVAAGLFASAGCTVGFSAGASVPVVAEPQMAYVSPGVWVVADHSEPVFYTNDAYWLYRGGTWYQSSYYSGGWVRAGVVPSGVRRIRAPRRYVRHRIRPGVRTRRVRARRGRARRAPQRSRRRPPRRTNVRDHRRSARPHRAAQGRGRGRAAPPRHKANKRKADKRKAAKRRKKKEKKVKVRDHR